MNRQGGNLAFIRLDEQIVGFIQFRIDSLTNWFFQEKMGFIREFWVSSKYRGRGHGRDLLDKVEEYLLNHHVYKVLLTTDTASEFYRHLGYVQDPSYHAKNEDEV